MHKSKSVWRPFTPQLLLSDQLGASNPHRGSSQTPGILLTLSTPHPLPPTYPPPPEWFLPTSICLVSLESISPQSYPCSSVTRSLSPASEVHLSSGLTSKAVFPQEWNLILPLLCFLWPQDGESSPQPGPRPELSRHPSSPSLPTAWQSPMCLAGCFSLSPSPTLSHLRLLCNRFVHPLRLLSLLISLPPGSAL